MVALQGNTALALLGVLPCHPVQPADRSRPGWLLIAWDTPHVCTELELSRLDSHRLGPPAKRTLATCLQPCLMLDDETMQHSESALFPAGLISKCHVSGLIAPFLYKYIYIYNCCKPAPQIKNMCIFGILQSIMLCEMAGPFCSDSSRLKDFQLHAWNTPSLSCGNSAIDDTDRCLHPQLSMTMNAMCYCTVREGEAVHVPCRSPN